jgi:hypothetical protein
VPTRTVVLELDTDDYDAVQDALAVRQAWRVMPDGEGDVAGRTIAEICRGWMEMIGRPGGGTTDGD